MASLVKMVKDALEARRCDRRAAAHYANGDFAEAADSYARSLALRPGHALTYFNLGMALYKARRRKEARDMWQRGLELAEGRQPYLEEQFRIVLRQFG